MKQRSERTRSNIEPQARKHKKGRGAIILQYRNNNRFEHDRPWRFNHVYRGPHVTRCTSYWSSHLLLSYLLKLCFCRAEHRMTLDVPASYYYTNILTHAWAFVHSLVCVTITQCGMYYWMNIQRFLYSWPSQLQPPPILQKFSGVVFPSTMPGRIWSLHFIIFETPIPFRKTHFGGNEREYIILLFMLHNYFLSITFYENIFCFSSLNYDDVIGRRKIYLSERNGWSRNSI